MMMVECVLGMGHGRVLHCVMMVECMPDTKALKDNTELLLHPQK